MNTIAGYSFPETELEASTWKPLLVYKPLHYQFLLIAKTRIEGEWSCYATPVPGQSHHLELHLWEIHGNKVREAIARAAFPQFAELPYND